MRGLGRAGRAGSARRPVPSGLAAIPASARVWRLLLRGGLHGTGAHSVIHVGRSPTYMAGKAAGATAAEGR